MIFSKLLLQNFRNYDFPQFGFGPKVTVVIGPNTAGKTNLVEAIYYLSYAKSFKTDKDLHLINLHKDVARIQGLLYVQNESDKEDSIKLEAVFAKGDVSTGRFTKKYFVNSVPKRRMDFAGLLPLVLFSPEELDIVVAGPSCRRQLLDEILEQSNREYRLARVLYDKALKQRNALLYLAKETGKRDNKQFEYWDELIIANGELITQKREELISYFNEQQKDIYNFTIVYDKSVISHERLSDYYDAENGAGITLVGPHRDDMLFFIKNSSSEMKYFASRGQQRLLVLQLKLLQLRYIDENLGTHPLLVLDDIFSELDRQNTELVLHILHNQQTIITTADEFFNEHHAVQNSSVIHLRVAGLD